MSIDNAGSIIWFLAQRFCGPWGWDLSPWEVFGELLISA